MHWSPTKRTGQKRSLKATESATSSSGEEEDEGEHASGGEEETEEEREEDGGKEEVEEGDRPGWEGVANWVHSEGVVTGQASGYEEQAQLRATETMEAEEGSRGPGPAEIRSPRHIRGSPSPRKEGEAGPGKPSVGLGPGITRHIRRSNVGVKAPTQKEVTAAERYNRGEKAKDLLSRTSPKKT